MGENIAMIKKQPEEQQPPRRYRYRATVSVSRTLVPRGEASQHKMRENIQAQSMKKESAEQDMIMKRRVTMPHETVQPLSWSERHERYQRHRQQPAQPQRQRLVQRTLSQTGRPAPVGPMRASKPLPRRGPGSSVPTRRRQKGQGRGFWRKFFGFLALLAIIIGGVSFALTISTFHIQQLTISGTQNQSLISSIHHMGIQGQNIFLLNQSAMLAQLEALPLVASANLVVQLPNSIVVNIQERVPVLLWQSGQSILGVAQDGMVIAPLSELSGASNLNSLTTVVDKRADAHVHPGTRFSVQDILFIERLFQQLPGIEGIGPFTLEYVDHIAVDGRATPANEGGVGSYVVASANGWLAYLGDETNSNPSANRLLELQQILSMARQQHLNLATIDLRFGLRPTYTLKS
jgi:hypothetical protein